MPTAHTISRVARAIVADRPMTDAEWTKASVYLPKQVNAYRKGVISECELARMVRSRA